MRHSEHNENREISRRTLLTSTGIATAAVATGAFSWNFSAANPHSVVAATTDTGPTSPLTPTHKMLPQFLLNTATLRGYDLTLDKEIQVAAEAGYSGMEIWVSNLQKFIDSGHTLAETRQRFIDANIQLVGAISFPNWIVDDSEQRKKALEQAKREMEMLATVGCPYMAAPAAGATRLPITDWIAAADRYCALLELGDSFGVIPVLELWGASATLSRLEELAAIAIATHHPKACLLLDVYHSYRGGNSFDSWKLLSPVALPIIHWNDYPATPERTTLTDADRVFPGDGAAPLSKICDILRQNGFAGYLSLELFNKTYWQTMDAATLAKTGLAKMRATCLNLNTGVVQ